MNLVTYLKSTTAAGYDHFGLRRFAANLVVAGQQARRRVELLEEIERGDHKHKTRSGGRWWTGSTAAATTL